MVHKIGLCFVVVLILVQGKSLSGSKKGVSPTETCKQLSVLDSKSDFPCTKIETTTSTGLKCKQKHDLLLGVAYPFKSSRLVKDFSNRTHSETGLTFRLVCYLSSWSRTIESLDVHIYGCPFLCMKVA